MRSLWTASVLVILLMGGAWSQVAGRPGNLIVDPDFSQAPDPRGPCPVRGHVHHTGGGWSMALPPNSRDVVGWSLLPGLIHVSGGETGTGKSLELISAGAGIEQSVPTVRGKFYELDLGWMTTWDSPRGRSLKVTLDGNPKVFTLGPNDGRIEHWTFVASGSQTTLAIQAVDQDEGLFIGEVYLGPPSAAAGPGGKDASSILTPLYQQLQEALDGGDIDALLAHDAPDFQYQAVGGAPQSLAEYRKTLENDLKNPQKFNPVWHQSVTATTWRGEGVVATVNDSYSCEWTDDQAVHHAWVRHTTHEDDWSKQGDHWVLLRTVVQKNTVTVDGQPAPPGL